MITKYIIAGTILSGTVIGAGMFVLPHIFFSAGLLKGFAYLLLFGVLTTLIHLMYAEVVLRTSEKHELSGYTRVYLGSTMGNITKVTQIIGITGSLVAYQVLGAGFVRLIIPSLSFLDASFIFFVLASIGVLAETSWLAQGELVSNGLLFVLVGYFFLVGLPHWRVLSWDVKGNMFMSTYGIVLYALIGYQAVREVIEYLRKEHVPITPFPFVLGSFFSVVLSGFFVVALLLLYRGTDPPLTVFTGLGVGSLILTIGGVLGGINMLDSFWTVGTYLRNVFVNDIGLYPRVGLVFTLGLPLLGGVLLQQRLLELLSVVGGVFFGFELLVILFLWRAARNGVRGTFESPAFSLPISSFLFWFLAALLSGGVLYSLCSLFSFL
ncbi:MAG: hypothetical protein KGI50_00035 [Patescibacteria group bacterium]|nr:hypothetical protein [Patescibacteria group bacterium]MDE2438249.1 hypothetical protein [Patescibacteria group bacterium]